MPNRGNSCKVVSPVKEFMFFLNNTFSWEGLVDRQCTQEGLSVSIALNACRDQFLRFTCFHNTGSAEWQVDRRSL